MTTRIDTRFAELKKQGRSAFVTYVMAGDPDPATSLEIVKALSKSGADVIELGIPFTDPMADGPSIQAAASRWHLNLCHPGVSSSPRTIFPPRACS